VILRVRVRSISFLLFLRAVEMNSGAQVRGADANIRIGFVLGSFFVKYSVLNNLQGFGAISFFVF
jgi:hypothetical protein